MEAASAIPGVTQAPAPTLPVVQMPLPPQQTRPVPAPTPAPAPPTPSFTPQKSAVQRDNEREQDLAHLTQLLRERGNIPELALANRALNITVDDFTHQVQITVVDPDSKQIVRVIPARSLSELIRPDVLPRGLLLRQIEGGQSSTQ